LAPEYEAAAQALARSQIEIPLAKIDATENSELIRSLEIEGFPTLIWYQ
jgi:hypothetical protein